LKTHRTIVGRHPHFNASAFMLTARLFSNSVFTENVTFSNHDKLIFVGEIMKDS
jgi:hypothetical protein